MEVKCKNCISFKSIPDFGDGVSGVCGQSGTLTVHNREDACDCASFVEMPKMERLKQRINSRLHSWIRERDDMFRRSMEIVAHIFSLFEQGEFKVFDAVKSSTDMKSIVFRGADVETSLYKVWTYHCPWNDDIEHFIVLSLDGKFITNTYIVKDGKQEFITECIDIEKDFDKCNEIIDRIREDCMMGIQMREISLETETSKCVSEEPNRTVCW